MIYGQNLVYLMSYSGTETETTAVAYKWEGIFVLI